MVCKLFSSKPRFRVTRREDGHGISFWQPVASDPKNCGGNRGGNGGNAATAGRACILSPGRDGPKVAGGAATRNPRIRHSHDSRPGGSPETRSPKIPLVIPHSAFFQHRQILLLECPGAMMLFLPQHISPNRFQPGGAHRKHPVSILPRECRPVQFPFDPLRRLRLHHPDQIRDDIRRLQPDEQMDVIPRPTHSVGGAAGIPDDSSQVSMEPRAEIQRKPYLPLLGGEDHVEDQRAMRRGHETHFPATLRGARKFGTGIRGLHPRLRSSAPAGAEDRHVHPPPSLPINPPLFFGD